MSPNDDFKLSPDLELQRILRCRKRRRSPASVGFWKRHHSDKIIEMSPRRLGVRLRDALMLKPT